MRLIKSVIANTINRIIEILFKTVQYRIGAI